MKAGWDWSRSFPREWGPRARGSRAQVYRAEAALSRVDSYTGQ